VHDVQGGTFIHRFHGTVRGSANFLLSVDGVSNDPPRSPEIQP
jgi:hypothetical protein